METYYNLIATTYLFDLPPLVALGSGIVVTVGMFALDLLGGAR